MMKSESALLPLIQVAGIWYRHHAQQPYVLQNVNCVVMPGRIYAVVGPSGVGKSTLLHCIAGLLQPERGYILRQQCEPSGGVTPEEEVLAVWRARHVGMAFQNSHLIESCTVLENVMLKRVALAVSWDRAQEEAMRVLSLVCVEQYAAAYPSRLSGGEQQRVALARALWESPALVLLDEPTAHADPVTKRQLLKLLCELADGGLTLVIATHDPDVVACADDCITMVRAGTYEEGCNV